MRRDKRSAAEELERMASARARLNGEPEPAPARVEFPPDAGYVYALVNTVWPGVVKIGMAGSVKRRFFSYMTGDPYRRYRMIAWSDVLLDPRQAEKQLHTWLDARRVEGSREWFRVTEELAVAAVNK